MYFPLNNFVYIYGGIVEFNFNKFPYSYNLLTPPPLNSELKCKSSVSIYLA